MRFGGAQAPGSAGRMRAALVMLAAIAGLAWWTLEPGRIRTLVWVLLGAFALRIVLAGRASR